MADMKNTNEPSTAPQPDRWYNLTLGSSFKDHKSSKFCTLRYEFKPASIDKNQRGTLKSKDNKVTVDFQNIQPGKPKMTFEGTSEDYKDNDAVLFFDGESFRLERLHRAIKRLRHNRTQGESMGIAAASAGLSDASPPPVVKGIKNQPLSKDTFHAPPAEVERIEIGDFKSSDAKPRYEKNVEYPAAQLNTSNPSPDFKNNEQDEEVQLDIMNDDDNAGNTGTVEVKEYEFDINIPHQSDTEDEIAVDVNVSDDEADKGPSAAEALKAQVNAEESQDGTSSSSDSSASESSGDSASGSASSSSSSGSESSDNDDVTSV